MRKVVIRSTDGNTYMGKLIAVDNKENEIIVQRVIVGDKTVEKELTNYLAEGFFTGNVTFPMSQIIWYYLI